MKRSRVFSSCAMVIFFQCPFSKIVCHERIDTIYKQIGDQLITIKKAYPTSQSKVYLALDQIDKMYNIAKTKNQQNEQLQESLKNKDLENTALHQELSSLKASHDNVQAQLEATKYQLDQERKLVAQLSHAQKETVNKERIAANSLAQNNLEKQESSALQELETEIAQQGNQNLNRTSTSEPNSPR